MKYFQKQTSHWQMQGLFWGEAMNVLLSEIRKNEISITVLELNSPLGNTK